jgi:hypothetical protein
MLDSIEERTRQDIAAAQQGVADRASELRDRATTQVDQLPGVEAVTEQVIRRPMTSLMAGFGTGIALGILGGAVMPDGRGTARSSSAYRGRRSESPSEESGGGMLGGMLGMLSGPAMSAVAGPVESELRSLLREAVSGFLGERGTSRGARPREQSGQASAEHGRTDATEQAEELRSRAA